MTYLRQASYTVGLMRYRKDRWASLRPEEAEGAFVTKTLRAGPGLSINASTEPGGSVSIEALDAEGTELPGYSAENAALFTGDAISEPVTWGGEAGERLPAEPFRLGVTLRRADLFALAW